jgi:hypothetical protein
MVFAKCTIGLKIILDAPDGTPSDMVRMESHPVSSGDSVSVSAR